MHNLALQVGELDRVVVHDDKLPDAAGCEIHRHRRAQSAEADDQYARMEQFFLPGDIYLTQQDMAAVA